MKVIITENHLKHLIDLLKEDIRPLKKLMECEITKDFKYILFDGKFYSTKTGNEVSLNEGWLTNTLRTGADMLSMGLDFVFPGTGAIVDALNALSMLIEAQFKSGAEKDSLYIMAIIQFGFILLPGPLQAMAPMLRNAVKTGKGLNSAPVKKGLGIIGGGLNAIFGGLNSIIQRATKSKLAKRLLGKWGPKINEFVSNFKNRIKTIFDSFKTKTPKPLTQPKASTETTSRISSNSDDHARIVTSPLNKVPDDYVQIWNNNSTIVANKKNKFPLPNGSDTLPPSTSGLPTNVKRGSESLPPSTSGLPTNVKRGSEINKDEFKKNFSTERTRGKGEKIEFSDKLNTVLKDEKFSPENISLGVQTIHSNNQKAVQIYTPKNGELIMYQDKNTWIPIEGYNGNKVIQMKGLENNNYVNDLIKYLNTNGI